MAIEIEILPQISIPENWQELITNKLNFINIKSNSVINRLEYYLSILDDNSAIHIWLSEKEKNIFTDSDYLESIKNINIISKSIFLANFKKINYTITIEYKGTTNDNNFNLLLDIVVFIAVLTDGLITFRNDFSKFKVDNIYLPKDIIS